MKYRLAKAMLFAFIMIILFGMITSCSQEKRIARFVKKEGAKPVAAFIAKEHPELFKPQTVRFDSLIEVPVKIFIPEYIKDTVIETVSTCSLFTYNDDRLLFKVRDNKVSYTIKSTTVRDTVYKQVFIEKEAQPCVTEVILDELRKENIQLLAYIEAGKNRWIVWFLRGLALGVLITLGGVFYVRKSN
jgi:hypothetical protein